MARRKRQPPQPSEQPEERQEPISYAQAHEAIAALAESFDATTPLISPPPAQSSHSAVLAAVRTRIGKTNRTCPKCGKETFKVARSKEQPDASTWRERQCESCGHVEERIAPAEKLVE